LGKWAKEGGMAGKMGWLLGLALAWLAACDASAQMPQFVSQDPPKLPPPAATPSEPAAPAAGLPAEKLHAPTPAVKTPSADPAAPLIPTTNIPVQPRFYASTDYLLWWMRRGSLPEQPLVTTGPPNSLNAGIVGQAGTQPLFGGANGLDWHSFSGVRATAGFNFSDDGNWGLEATGFFLPRQTLNFNFASAPPGTGTPVITRPFFDNLNNSEAAYDVSFTDPNTGAQTSGNLNIQATTIFWGYEVNLTHHIPTINGTNLELYFGYRSLALDERLSFFEDFFSPNSSTLTFEGMRVPQGQHVTTTDFFGTSNRFYAPQLGAAFGWQWGRLGASLTGKIAAGVAHQNVVIAGDSTFQQNQVTGGILAQQSNIGNYSRDVFCVVPELDLGLTFDITNWLRARIGYNVIYWSSVVRPGKQIDRNIDITQVPTDQAFGQVLPGGTPPTNRPAFSFRDTDFWAQGLSFGLEIRY
jgi:hypothetical protein